MAAISELPNAGPSRQAQNRVRRFLSGLAAVWSGQTISMIENLAVVPIYLWYWSPERYGEWLALSALVGYLGTLDLGMNMAGGNKLTQEYARGDLGAFRLYQRAALVFYLSIAIAGTILLAFVVVALPITQWTGLKLTGRREAALVVFLLGSQVLWSMPAGFITGTYRAMGDMGRTAWVTNAQNVAAVGLAAACLLVGGGMVQMAFVELSCMAVTTVLVLFDLKRNHSAAMPGLGGARLSLIRELVRPSASFGLLMLSEAIRLQAIVLLVSRVLGARAVTVFVSSRTLCNLARQMTGTLKNAVWPHVTAIEAQGQYTAIRPFHRMWVVGSTALCLAIAAALWFEGASVIQVWTRGKLTGDVGLLRLLLIQMVLQSPWLASGLISVASSRHGKLSLSYFWSSLIAVGVTSLLIRQAGLLAIPIGSIAGEGLICYHFVTRDTCAMIGEPYGPFAVSQWLFVILCSCVSLLCGWLVHGVAAGPAPVRWAEVGLTTLSASLLAAWYFGFRPADRVQAATWLRLAGSRA
jgi:O-antigen/teichoic acid export membrane protein